MGARQKNDEHGFERWRDSVSADDRAKMLERTRRQYAEYLSGYEPGGCGVAMSF